MTADVDAHSEHGASIANRWINCPGSVGVSRGFPNNTSPAAEEGTDAHALGEYCLRSHQDAEEWIDRDLMSLHRPGRLKPAAPITADMADAVQIYLDECRRVPALPGLQKVEQRITLETLAPPAPMFGTADYLAYIPETETLRIVDLKYGRGVQVYAKGNPQLMYYALGAMLFIPHSWGVVRHIEATIVQARARRNPVRTVTLDAIDLAEWSIPLLNAAAATLEPDAPLNAGTWCKFCPARGRCPAQAAAALEIAMGEFADDLPILTNEDGDPCCPHGRALHQDCLACDVSDSNAVQVVAQQGTRLIQVGNRHLTPAELGALLRRVPEARQALHDIEEAAHQAIRDGGLPGWKEVDNRPTTRWRDPATAEGMLVMDLGLPETAIYQPRELISPAKAREAIRDNLHSQRLEVFNAAKPGAERGKKPTKKDAEADARKALADLTFTSSSGKNLVPDEDARPALASAAEEFTGDLPALTDETVEQ